jgi:hypothetical protein
MVAVLAITTALAQPAFAQAATGAGQDIVVNVYALPGRRAGRARSGRVARAAVVDGQAGR